MAKAQAPGTDSKHSPARQMFNVMHAVILRDIRSRFFNHGLGFLIVPLLPLGHIGLLLILYNFTPRETVYGENLSLFFATGLAPVLAFSYLSRFMSVSLLANKGMMAFPVVQLLDLILARAFLEFMGMNLAIFTLFIALIMAGAEPYPIDPGQALLAYLVTIVLGLGVGILVSIFAAMVPMVAMIYALLFIVFYLSSGAPIYLHTFPEQVIKLCAWNPVFHSAEWMRSAYYRGYPTQYLDKEYLVSFAFGSLALGLLLERVLRRQILNG